MKNTRNYKKRINQKHQSCNKRSDTYWWRQKQPMQTTVTQIIRAAAAMITITTNTANKYNILVQFKTNFR